MGTHPQGVASIGYLFEIHTQNGFLVDEMSDGALSMCLKCFMDLEGLMTQAETLSDKLFSKMPRIPWCFAGWGFGWVFSEIMYIKPPVDLSAGRGPEAFLCYDASTIVVAVLIALAAFFFPDGLLPLKRRRAWFIASAGAFCASILLNFAVFVGIVTTAPFVWAAALFAGVGSATSYALWGELFGCLPPVRMVATYVAGAVLRYVLIWILSPLPPDRLLPCMLVVAVLTLVTLRMAYRKLSPEDLPSSPIGRFSFPSKPMVVIALCAFTFAMLMSFVGDDLGVNGNPGVLVAAALVAFIISRKGEDFNFSSSWALSLLSMLVALIPFGRISSDVLFVSGVFGSLAYTLYLMLTSVIFANLSFRYAVSAAWLFSIEIATRLIFAHAGSYVGDSLQGVIGSGPSMMVVVACSIPVAAFAVAMLIVFSSKGLNSDWGVVLTKPFSKDYELALEKSRLGIRCREVSGVNGLTSREEEILLLLWRKKRPADIATDMNLSVSTVRTHVKHIYAKLNVHSSKELLGLIEVDE